MTGFDKERLFQSRLAEAEVEIPDLGVIKVRALSRAEVLLVQRGSDGSPEVLERKLLALALVDPVLTEAEVGKWQAASVATEIEVVTNRVAELSGMDAGAAKRAYKEFESDPDAEFPILPSPGAGDDGGSNDGGDV